MHCPEFSSWATSEATPSYASQRMWAVSNSRFDDSSLLASGVDSITRKFYPVLRPVLQGLFPRLFCSIKRPSRVQNTKAATSIASPKPTENYPFFRLRLLQVTGNPAASKPRIILRVPVKQADGKMAINPLTTS